MIDKQVARRFMPLVPALCTFGPLEMVQGYDSPYHVISEIAALVTAVGILIIFANVMLLIKESEPLPAPRTVTSRMTILIAALTMVAALFIGGAAFYIVGHRLP